MAECKHAKRKQVFWVQKSEHCMKRLTTSAEEEESSFFSFLNIAFILGVEKKQVSFVQQTFLLKWNLKINFFKI